MKITLHGIHCQTKTESDADEIYCTITTGDAQQRQLARIEIGNFEIGTNLQPNKLLWNGSGALLVTIVSWLLTAFVSDRGRVERYRY